MTDIVDYLITNYYEKLGLMYERQYLTYALEKLKDKTIVIRRGGNIVGVAVYLALTNDSYLKFVDRTEYSPNDVDDLSKENGENVHFILVCTNGSDVILEGLKEVIKCHSPRIVSWWNRDRSKLNKYRLN